MLFSTILSSPSKGHYLQPLYTLFEFFNSTYFKENSVLFTICVFRLAWQAMRQLHPEAIAAIQSKALFSQAEEALLAKITSVSEAFIFIAFHYCGELN